MMPAWIDTSSADTGSSSARIFGCSAKRPRDADALLLPAGELSGVAAGVFAPQPDDPQQLGHPFVDAQPCRNRWPATVPPARRRRAAADPVTRPGPGTPPAGRRAALVAPAGPVSATSAPSTSIEPACGAVSSRIWCSVVDLPEPDSPTMPSVRPCCSSKLTPSTARTSPTWRRNTTPLVSLNVLTRSRTCSTTGPIAGRLRVGGRLGGDAVDVGGAAPLRPGRCGCTPRCAGGRPRPVRVRRRGTRRSPTDSAARTGIPAAARPVTAARRGSAPAGRPAPRPGAAPSREARRCTASRRLR